MRRLLFLPLAFLLTAVFSLPALAEKRVALVVGNSNYSHISPLQNPANDARLLAEALRSVGFTLIRGEAQLDLDKQSFEKVIQEFGAKLQGADVGLFYYAGHGVQVRGVNYLVPVDANPSREADVGIQMLDAKLIVSQMEGTGTKLNIVILDACRNDPFSGRAIAMGRGRDNEMVKMRDIGGGGLAEMQAPEGTLISFATQPGNTAEDGEGGHSPYAAALSEVIRIPGLGIFDSFNQVGLKVKYATGKKQQPWMSNSPIDGAFYFVPAQGAAAATINVSQSAEEIAWDYLKDTADAESLRRFVTKFPQGARADEAQARIAALEQGTTKKRLQSDQTKSTAPQAPVTVGNLSPDAERGLKPSEHFKECDNCPEMVVVPGGNFMMGSPGNELSRTADEGPQQPITFGHSFAVGRSAVTFAEWNTCVAEGGCNAYRPGDYSWGGGKRPVINVSWDDAQSLREVAVTKDRGAVSLAQRSRTRIRRPGLHGFVPVDAVLVRRRDFPRSRQLRLALFLCRQRQGAAAAAHRCDRCRASPIHSDFSRCMVMSANGSRTAGMQISRACPEMARRERQAIAPATSCGAAHGRTSRRICGRPSAPGK